MQRYTILALALFAGIGVCLGAVIPDPSLQDALKLTNEQPHEALTRQERAADHGFGDYGGHGHHHGGGYGGHDHGGGFGGGYYPGGYGGYDGHHHDHHHHHNPYYGNNGGYYGGYPGYGDYGYGGGYGPGFGIYFG